MAHFAEIDNNNKVLRVIVVADSDTKNSTGVEEEVIGQVFCNQLLGGNWKQTSYHSTIRKHYAGAGYTYSSELDAFIPPQPYPSWTLDANCDWQPPTKMPDDGKMYRWDEATLNWIEV